jgi:Restriction endonuclease NotI
MAKFSTSPGNFISEWFGQRIYPRVQIGASTLGKDGACDCPFLSQVLHRQAPCVKSSNSSGVCTVSSTSNGPRQDWLVCPYRVISSEIVSHACQTIFGLGHAVTPIPVSLLQSADELKRFEAEVQQQRVGYLFFQDKLGGEISVLGTPRSPEMSFDVTLVEVVAEAAGFRVARYGILEIQTMDYHGSYKHAVQNLRDGLRLHPKSFASALTANLEHWAGEGVEGPNIANVFKRTFYQTLLKFKLAGAGAAAAGTVLALPRSVWDSWQPFLGAPTLEDEASGVKRFAASRAEKKQSALNAYICVFDLDATAPHAISPVVIEHFVRVSPERLAHQAYDIVPEHILHAMQTEDSVVSTIRSRLARWWPAFKIKPARRGAKARSADPDPAR